MNRFPAKPHIESVMLYFERISSIVLIEAADRQESMSGKVQE